MSGYLQRLIASARAPRAAIRPLVGSFFAKTIPEEDAEPLEVIQEVVASRQPEALATPDQRSRQAVQASPEADWNAREVPRAEAPAQVTQAAGHQVEVSKPIAEQGLHEAVATESGPSTGPGFNALRSAERTEASSQGTENRDAQPTLPVSGKRLYNPSWKENVRKIEPTISGQTPSPRSPSLTRLPGGKEGSPPLSVSDEPYWSLEVARPKEESGVAAGDLRHFLRGQGRPAIQRISTLFPPGQGESETQILPSPLERRQGEPETPKISIPLPPRQGDPETARLPSPLTRGRGEPNRPKPLARVYASPAGAGAREVPLELFGANLSRGSRRPEREADEIHIHIGRIEVMAVQPPPARPASQPARKSLRLDEYLKRSRERAS
jgi:hypothetical protein